MAWKVQEIPRCTDRNMWGHFRYSQTSCLASPCHWSSLMGPVSHLLALSKCLGHPKVSSRLQKLILAFWVSPQPKIRFAQGCSQSLHLPAGSRERACFNSALLAWGQAPQLYCNFSLPHAAVTTQHYKNIPRWFSSSTPRSSINYSPYSLSETDLVWTTDVTGWRVQVNHTI